MTDAPHGTLITVVKPAARPEPIQLVALPADISATTVVRRRYNFELQLDAAVTIMRAITREFAKAPVDEAKLEDAVLQFRRTWQEAKAKADVLNLCVRAECGLLRLDTWLLGDADEEERSQRFHRDGEPVDPWPTMVISIADQHLPEYPDGLMPSVNEPDATKAPYFRLRRLLGKLKLGLHLNANEDAGALARSPVPIESLFHTVLLLYFNRDSRYDDGIGPVRKAVLTAPKNQ